MCIVSFDIPNDVLYARNLPREQASGFARARFAAALYMEGGITLEYAAGIAGLPLNEFRELLRSFKPFEPDLQRVTIDAQADAGMKWLLGELDKGVQSGEQDGWLSEEEMNERFECRRADILASRRS